MPTTPQKLKADDYLLELANQSTEEWFKSLIARIILLRPIPDDAFLDEIYKKFLLAYKLREKKPGEAETALRVVVFPGNPTLNGFILKKLQHESGVNALERGATIP